MPKSLQHVPDPDRDYNLSIRVPGWLKNQVVDVCVGEGVSLNEWLGAVVVRAVREGWGVPPVPVAQGGVPSTGDEIRAWARGERLLGPCGGVWPCEGVGRVGVVGGVGFCGVCGVRVS